LNILLLLEVLGVAQISIMTKGKEAVVLVVI
jgi:hypothetical protein